MLVKESLLVLKDSIHSMDNTDEAEETLSLCDLPLYGDDVDYLVQESLNQSSNSYSKHINTYFEFLTQELDDNVDPTFSTNSSEPDNIIFCGKLIPYKQPDAIPRKDASKPIQNTNQIENQSCSRRSSKRRNHGSNKSCNIESENQNECKKKTDSPVKKMSILTSSPSEKAKWYWLVFGISGLSPKIDLRRIKSRQIRRLHPSTSPTSSPLFRFQSSDEKIATRKSGGCGLWGIVRALSCGSQHHAETNFAPSLSGA